MRDGDRIAPHAGWASTWSAAPSSDWDELRLRLRSLHAPEIGCRQSVQAAAAEATPALEMLHGPQPARVSWRAAPGSPPARLRDRLLHDLPLPRWWSEHDPLTVQRVLLVIALLLTVELVFHLF